MDVVYHLPKVLTESDDNAVRIIWMAYTVGKLKVIKSSLSLPDGVGGKKSLFTTGKMLTRGSKVQLLGSKPFEVTLTTKIL